MAIFGVVLTSLAILCHFQVLRAEDIVEQSPSPKWRSGAPDDLPKLSGMKVDCGREDMTVALKFDRPFDGSVYSKPSGRNSERCVHVAPHSYVTDATFAVEYDRCGTRSDPKGKYHENTVIIQYDDIVIEAWDIAKKIRCEWHDGYEKSAFKQPIAISDLDVVEMNFQGDDVDCWLEIQDGKGPWSSKVEGLIPIGSPLTLVVAIQDIEGQFDMRVKSCKAHDGLKQPVYLTDEEGCVLRPKMMSPFVKTKDTKGTATIVSYSHFYAFKFPETVEVNVQCTVEICRHGCPDSCSSDNSGQHDAPYSYEQSPHDSDNEDIPTYRDSNPPTSIIANGGPSRDNSSNNRDTNDVEILRGSLNVSTSSDKDLQGTNSEALNNFYPQVFPPNLFDVLHAEDRSDQNPNEYGSLREPDIYDTEFAANEADLEYKPSPEFLRDIYSNAKNFPTDEHFISNASIGQVANERHENSTETAPTPTTEYQTIIPTTPQTTMVETTTDEQLVTTDLTTQEPIVSNSTQINLAANLTTPHSPIEVTSEPLVEYDGHSVSVEHTDGDGLLQISSSTRSIEDEPHISGIDTENIIDLDGYRDEPQRETPIEHQESLEYGSEETDHKSYLGHEFERVLNPQTGRDRVQGRTGGDDKQKPIDYYRYKPFKQPPPVPPLTLYNGIPLHYYHQHEKDAELMRRTGHYRSPQAAGYAPRYHGESRDFNQRHRRKRRDIGENEQLGLQQTFRVIAPTDLDFIIRDNVVAKKKEILLFSLCMAKTSFASGLGLLLIANVCVLGVAIFLGHHYFRHRKKTKSQAMELLTKDITN